MSQITRRRFFEESLLAAAAVAGTPLLARADSRWTGGAKRDPLRVAVVGVRGRGRAHIKAFRDSPDAEVVAICDVDEAVIGPAMKAVPDAVFYRDIRKLLEDDGIDVVSIATPNHWHSLGAAWALEAGKHVYVEKPLSHDFREGRAVVEIARRTGLVCQHGTQARSHAATRDAIAWLRAGGLGEVKLATALCYKRRESIGKVSGPQEPPSTLDYDLWTGPAPLKPLMRQSLHYDWHWDFDTGNGDIGNQGVHQMDIARWGLGLTGFPRAVRSVGGRVGYEDDGNTPNSQIATYDYGEKQIVFEVRGLPTAPYHDTTIGVVFHCEGGYLVSSAYERVLAFDRDGAQVKVFEGGGDHVQNFLDAVRSGKREELASDCHEGHLSSGLCHLGNVSYRLGAAMKTGLLARPFGEDAAANESYARMVDHFRNNELDGETPFVVGPRLAFDAATESFTGEGAAAANRLLDGHHRAPFVLPKIG